MKQLAKEIDDLTRRRDELEARQRFLEDYLKNKWFELLCRVEEKADDVFDTGDFEYGCEYRWRRRSIVYEAKKVLGYKTWREKKERLTRTNSKP